MTHSRVHNFLLALVLGPLLVAGCASTGTGGSLSTEAKCAIAGAAVGAAAGVLLEGEIVGALVGGGAGAVMSAVVCGGPADSDGDGVTDDADKCPGTPKEAYGKVDETGCPLDTDGDGVPDYKDQCPTPAGVKVDATGCAIDSDGDGVRDDVDQCPDTRAGVKVDEFGCPGDADADGVTDDLDQGPDTPAGWKVDSRGCPMPIVFRNVNFAFDSAALDAEAREALDKQVAEVLRDNLPVRARIVGHTDSVGTDAYNQGLSERRAQSVADYLFTRGIIRSRIETAGRGESDPVAPNSVEAGRAANRRVEIYAIK